MGIVLGAVSGGFIGWYLRSTPERRSVSRFAFAFPSPGDGDLPAASAGYPLKDFPAVAISRDGAELAYIGRLGETTHIFLRSVERLESQPLAGTANATSPFFSPDGQWVGFFADGKLKKVSVNGGQPVTLCDAPLNRSGSWGPDDTIIFSPTLFGGLMRVSAAGGSPDILDTPDASKGELSYRWPEILPGGKTVAFVIAGAKDIGFFSESKIAVERLDTHEKKILPIQGTYPRYSPSGHLLFAREGSVFAVPFDVNRLQVTGPPVPVLEGVKASVNSGVSDFMVSDTGSLVYLPGDASPQEGLLVWMDRKHQMKELSAPPHVYHSPHISPDGQRVAVSIYSRNHGDVWVFEIAKGTLTRLTFGEQSAAPVWSPDGKYIAFANTGGAGHGIFAKAADGSGAEETLVSGENLLQVPSSWSPDGKFLAYWTVGEETGRDVWLLPLTGERKPQPLLQTKFNEQQAKFSPDGRWLAYMSDEAGRFEIYVRPFPGPGGKLQISTDGGTMPLWAPNGHELFYLSTNRLMSVNITTQPSFSASVPRIVADRPPPALVARLDNSVYDVSPDGQQFLFVKANLENARPDEVRVVLNWVEEVKRLTSASKQP
jgi:serine/threonine-protein kinase